MYIIAKLYIDIFPQYVKLEMPAGMSMELNLGQRYGPSRIGLTASTVLFDFNPSISAN
jgi:hypothetical protein